MAMPKNRTRLFICCSAVLLLVSAAYALELPKVFFESYVVEVTTDNKELPYVMTWEAPLADDGTYEVHVTVKPKAEQAAAAYEAFDRLYGVLTINGVETEFSFSSVVAPDGTTKQLEALVETDTDLQNAGDASIEIFDPEKSEPVLSQGVEQSE